MAHLIPIGNSQGIRIPRAVIQQANLANKELQFKVTDDGLLIRPIEKTPRENWLQKTQEILAGQSSHDMTAEDRDWLDAPLLDGDATW